MIDRYLVVMSVVDVTASRAGDALLLWFMGVLTSKRGAWCACAEKELRALM